MIVNLVEKRVNKKHYLKLMIKKKIPITTFFFLFFFQKHTHNKGEGIKF